MTRPAETEDLGGMHPTQAFYFSLANLWIPRQLLGNRVILISKMTRRYKIAAAVSSIATFAALAYAFGRLLGIFWRRRASERDLMPQKKDKSCWGYILCCSSRRMRSSLRVSSWHGLCRAGKWCIEFGFRGFPASVDRAVEINIEEFSCLVRANR